MFIVLQYISFDYLFVLFIISFVYLFIYQTCRQCNPTHSFVWCTKLENHFTKSDW